MEINISTALAAINAWLHPDINIVTKKKAT